ncbi:MAG: ATP-dependent helicase [Acidipropionibacterium jensenii]|uniref:ATP-dependent DNA helicase n=1 Tax=Acidipropionibacterium jensenii TaxID=1749 RepID=UPI00264874DF|nr:ATP-dependent DNA helicase [Acidipropionibacterium jensenii]MDN5977592.1 ATP-dependent helicase [Acidipropionibacterium jensenii]
MITTARQVGELLDIPFSEEQLAVIGAPLHPCVVIAGAGTGKTTVMAARVVWLVASGQVAADQGLGLTFTRKACAELAGRIDTALAKAGIMETGDPSATVSTYDGFAASLVDEYGAWDGIETGDRLILKARCHQLALEVVTGLDHPPRMADRLTPMSIATAIVSLSGQMGSHLVDVDRVRSADRSWRAALAEAPTRRGGQIYADVARAMDTVDEREEMLGMVEAYRRLKQERGLVEYADRMAQAAHLAGRRSQVGRDLRRRFRVVLLDEYQDTSSAQAQLLSDLFTGPDPDSGLGHPVTAVGDPLQAIYGWRGAAASNILGFSRQFPILDRTGQTRPAQEFSLLTNRRSGTRILDCANDISAELRESGEIAGRVGALVAPVGTRPGEVVCHGHLSWTEECAWVADQLVEARARGRIDSWSQAAVLVRRNGDVADLHAALVNRQIPVQIANLSGLLQLPDVVMVVAHLRVLADRRDNQAWSALLAAPRLGLSPDDLAAVGRRAGELARTRAAEDRGLPGDDSPAAIGPDRPQPLLADAVAEPGRLSESGRLSAGLARLASETRVLSAHAVDGPDDLVLRIQQVTGLADELAADEPARARARQGHLDALWSEIHSALRDDPDLTLPGLTAWLAAEEEFGDGLARSLPESSDAVVISTVHGAKGLEWPLVMLPDLDDGVFPSSMPPDNPVTRATVLPSAVRGDADQVAQPQSGAREDLAAYKDALGQESRGAEDRLGYVALTRARDRLVVSWHRWRPPAVRPRVAGRYAEAVATRMAGWGLEAVRPPEDEDTPTATGGPTGTDWPEPVDPDRADRLTDLAARVGAGRGAPAGLPDDPQEAQLVAGWRRDAAILLAAARRQAALRSRPDLPLGLTTSQVVALHADRRTFLDSIRRPMPRRVLRGADIGTRFHEWLADYLQPGGQEPLALLDEGGAPLDPGVSGGPDDPVLARLQRAFLASRWADARPLAIEEPFTLTVAGLVIRGRLDAVLADPDRPGEQVVVDWKTSAPDSADPLQLSVYRLAWAGATGVDPQRVRAVFHHVGANQTVEAHPLLSMEELARVLSGESAPARQDTRQDD